MTTNGGPSTIGVAVRAVGEAGAGVEQHAVRPAGPDDRLGDPVGARERRAGLAVGDELHPEQQPAPADLADVRVAAEALAEQRLEPLALRGARLDEVLVLEDPQHLAGHRRADGVVRVGEAVDEAGGSARTASRTAPEAATNPNGK